MSAYSHQQFCLGSDGQVRLALRAHPDLPHLMLTISLGPESEFTLSAGADHLRAVVRQLAALFEGPALAPDQTRTITCGETKP